MSPLAKILTRIVAVLLIMFLAIQPYNWFCSMTNSCSPFFLSYYIEKDLGSKISISIEAANYNKDLSFSVIKPLSDAYTNKKIKAIYHAKNSSKKTVKFRPVMIIEPRYVEEYLIRYECLCFRQYKLNSQEEIDMPMVFEIDEKIEKDERFKADETIKIGYRIHNSYRR